MNTNSSRGNNQNYWIVVREGQDNVLISSSNIPVEGVELQYTTDNGDSIEYAEPTDYCIEDEPQQTVEVSTRSSREDPFWDKNKTRVFLSILANNKYKNCNPKNKEMWKEIAPVIGATPDGCYRKYKSLKSTFVRMYKKRLLGKNVKWFCYNSCEELFKDNKFMNPDLDEAWDKDKIRRLLTMYIELFSRFSGSAEERKQCWTEIAHSLGTTELNCIRKYRDLRSSYISRISKQVKTTGKAVKWPYLSFFQQICSKSFLPKDKWDKQKVKQLLLAFMERTHKFADSKYLKKDLWTEISSIVGIEAAECDKKFRNLKIHYKRIKEMESSGGIMSRWKYYKYFEELNNDRHLSADDDQFLRKNAKGDKKTFQMLEFYIQNKDKFMNPKITKNSLWKIIGPKLKLTSYECDKKFRNLKQSYFRIIAQQHRTGKSTVHWPYYPYFEQLYDKTETLKGITFRKQRFSPNVREVITNQVNKIVGNVPDCRDANHKFERLMQGVEESNNIQRERNKILWALLDKYQ